MGKQTVNHKTNNKKVYYCSECKQVVICHRSMNTKPYVKWCCGKKMKLIPNKCPLCKMRIRGSNHFLGKHHLNLVSISKK